MAFLTEGGRVLGEELAAKKPGKRGSHSEEAAAIRLRKVGFFLINIASWKLRDREYTSFRGAWTEQHTGGHYNYAELHRFYRNRCKREFNESGLMVSISSCSDW